MFTLLLEMLITTDELLATVGAERLVGTAAAIQGGIQ